LVQFFAPRGIVPDTLPLTTVT